MSGIGQSVLFTPPSQIRLIVYIYPYFWKRGDQSLYGLAQDMLGPGFDVPKLESA